jgi:hypothetical protein
MPVGGYRVGSGRSKSGYYNGIYCGSTYELCWVIYNFDHSIEFTRFPGKLEKDGITYYPDFLLSDGKTIVETKGYEKQESVDKKTKVAESFGYSVKVLRKEDLQYAFEYVTQKYGTKKYFELYDGYKPKYKHLCDCCKIEFETDRKIKTEAKFCSRICAGRYQKSKNTINNKMTDEVKKKISDSLLGKKVKPYKRKYKQVWITDGKVNTRIKEGDEIPEGFKQGRTVSH